MSKLVTAKEFYEENKTLINGFMVMSGLFAYGIGMYAFGAHTAKKANEIGLAMCIAAKPELGPMLKEALEKVKETVK